MMNSEVSQADSEDERDRKIRDLRVALWANMDLISETAEEVVGIFEELASEEPYDVEYAEGDGEFAKYLREIGRVTTVARALMPTDSTGENVSSEFRKTVKALRTDSYLK